MYKFLMLCVFSVVAGCATAPNRPISLQLDIAVATDANPDESGRPSPVVLSIYDLAHAERFGHSDYVALLSTPRKCLRSDLLGVHRTQTITPGTHHISVISLEPQAAYAGVIAELVQFSDTTTRIEIPVRPNRKNQIKLLVDSRGISVRSDGPFDGAQP